MWQIHFNPTLHLGKLQLCATLNINFNQENVASVTAYFE